jgi:hypothetical protein
MGDLGEEADCVRGLVTWEKSETKMVFTEEKGYNEVSLAHHQ